MSWRGVALASLILGTAAMSASLRATGAEDSKPVTYYKDVLPILQNNFQTCHRPGEIAPMSFLTYKDTRPWAKGIKNAVVTRQMPPWFADSKYGHFANDRTLDDATIKTLVAWADGGAAEGNPKDAPKPVEWVDGWSLKPDMVIEMPQDVPLPATGTINYKSILVKVNFPRGSVGRGRGFASRQSRSRPSHARDRAASGLRLDEECGPRRGVRRSRS